MLYKLGLSYITPVIRAMLSYNRLLNRVPKNEIGDIHWRIMCLFFSELLMPIGIATFVYARLWKPAPRELIYSIITIIAIIAFFFMQKIKKAKVYQRLIEEANKLTKEEHKARRRDLLPTFILYYMMPIISVMLLCALFQHLIPRGYLL